MVRALARQEARRHLRSPMLPLGLAGFVYLAWVTRTSDDWSGIEYGGMPGAGVTLFLGVSLLVASSFRRERAGLVEDAPTGETTRATGRLLGAGVLVLVVAAATAVQVMVMRAGGGVDLGDEPGRTLHAHHTLPEVLQPVCVALVAVALGALLGRRVQQRAATTIALFAFWYLTAGITWLFQAAPVRPWSIVMVHPVEVRVGPHSADPLTFPEEWLLSAPDAYEPFWGRLVVSPELATAHDMWLIGLACVLVAFALPRRTRGRLLVVGGMVAAVAVIAQYAVAP
ncbi:hypothetical protein DDE18_01325 [Nocardioides gansuensis]|uniref:Uncharacterized protein n=1 Tax=Nocardioides gansuensis TaxID=2138300 RepID=A0A2T8FF04_9ACTN|nr:hypothetical protein DDE18_01325 [Nocardioides gansuensis]